MTGGYNMMWSFFGSGHGKGTYDGVGVVIKHFIWHEQLNTHGTKLQNAEDVFNFLRANLFECFKSSYIGKNKPIRRMFWHVKFDDVDHCLFSFACDIVEGTMKIHCICAINKHVLTQPLVKLLACFYALCVENMWDECANVKWIRDWISKHLQPIDTRYVRDSMNNVWDGTW
jgi:hypothetical protein